MPSKRAPRSKGIPPRGKKTDSIIPQTKLLRLFQIIAVLKTGRWTIKSLADRFDTSERTIYRYIKLLEEIELLIEKDFDGKYFIHSSQDELGTSEFTLEEMKLIKKLIQTEVDNNPLKELLLKKLSLNSELDKVPNLIVHARRGKLVEQLSQAIKDKKQLVLRNYHSANSSEITDRLVESIGFGDNYQTVVALDTKDKQTKQFKIDRIGEIVETGNDFKFESQHQKAATDIFGMTGGKSTWITLNLRMRSFLLLREEHPLALPYIEKSDEGHYKFHGPVSNLDGIGRFVMGLLDEIEVIGPPEFTQYIKSKISKMPSI
jgi:predicted DNA-binding transcriptional regulator YafY